MKAKPADVDSYMSGLADDARAALQELRRMIKEVAPDAVEDINYDVPTFKYRGKPLIYIAAWKKHIALYRANLGAHKDELAGYETAKGTVRFPIGQPLPEELVRKLVRTRLAEIDA